jgi:hypothetical protein
MESQSNHSIADFETVRSLGDDELLAGLTHLVAQDRRFEAEIVAHIGEIDERRLFARRAFPSMFAYCTQALHLSEAEAYRRITVARAARRCDGLLDWLRDGRIHLTGMALLVPVLKPESYRSVLERATHRSKHEIQKLVAELSPRPDVPALIRKLPQRRSPAAPSAGPQPAPIADSALGAIVEERGSEVFPETVGKQESAYGVSGVLRPDGLARLETRPELFPETVGGHESPDGSPGTAPRSDGQVELGNRPELFPETVAAPLELPKVAPRTGVVEPLSPARYKVQFTASQELRDMLERLTTLMRAEVPDGDLATLIERAVAEKLQRLEARRFGKTQAPRKTLAQTATAPGSRYVPAPVRRAVHERDGGRCRFVDEQGRRCSERNRLEFHHHFPFGKGGDTTVANTRLLCPQHNRHVAEVDYGNETLRARREKSQARAQHLQ